MREKEMKRQYQTNKRRRKEEIVLKGETKNERSLSSGM
jgi:hypothetical protein